MKATQRVSALRGGQPDDLIASGAGCEGISLRGASMRRKIGPNRPGIRGISVNTYSEIVGGADTADGKEHAFFFADRKMYDLGPGQANAINDDRRIVGKTDTPVAFLWDGAMHDLNGMIGANDPLRGKVQLTDAQAINKRGEIVAEDCTVPPAPLATLCEIFLLTPTERGR